MTSQHNVWAADPQSFTTRKVCPLRHDFSDHPLIRIDELGRLAKELASTGQCKFIKPGTTHASEFTLEGKSSDGRSLDEVFARIEEPRSWVALYNVETIPRYRALLNEAILSVRSLIDGEQPGLFRITGFIFISAPPAVTPFHIDRENNFWLQIAGRKRINVWEHIDRNAVPASAVEKFILGGSLRDVAYRPEILDSSHEYDVGPGDGVYFPSTSPHMTRTEEGWTKPGDGVSISIGVNFYTEYTRRIAHVHAGNRLLRKLGFSPAWPGQSTISDSIKFGLGKAFVLGRKWVRGAQPAEGFNCTRT